jgi:hypothetical protein
MRQARFIEIDDVNSVCSGTKCAQRLEFDWYVCVRACARVCVRAGDASGVRRICD